MTTMFKIFVGNVSFSTTEEQIRNVLTPHIVIEEVVIAKDDTGKPKGYAFVLTKDENKGRSTIHSLGKPLIDGRRIYFKESHGKKKPKPQRPRVTAQHRRRGFQQRRPKPRPSRPVNVGGYSGAYEGAQTSTSTTEPPAPPSE